MKDHQQKTWFSKHKVLTVLLALFGVAVIASAANGGGGKSTNTTDRTTSTSTNKTANAASTTPKIGQAARDGKFEFTVNSIKCGETSVGSQYLNKTAQGQYCRLNLTVKNIGDQSQSLDSGSQYLFNTAGQKYSADDTATLYAEPSESNNSWYTDINPGNSVTGDILFDIPINQMPATAELHDSALSGGVKVRLQ